MIVETSKTVLEIGPEPRHRVFADSIAVDCEFRDDVEVIAQWGFARLPFGPEQFDLIYASHVLEHVPWYRTRFALDDAFRVLKPGGALEVWVPDLRKIVDVWLSGEFPDEDWTVENDERDPMKWFCGRLFCGTSRRCESSWHRAAFDAPYLRRCLERSGFSVSMLARPPAGQKTNHEFINLGARGVKPCVQA